MDGMESDVVIKELWKYPISGGPGIALQEAHVLPGGIENDRIFIVATDENGTFKRVGTKQAPELLTIQYDEQGCHVSLDGETLKLPYRQLHEIDSAEADCLEFGQLTPVAYTSPEHDEAFSEFLKRDVRLLRKTSSWLIGAPHHPAPRLRSVAPLHLLSEASVEDVAQKAGVKSDARRYKAGILLTGLEAHQELQLLGKIFRFGDFATRATVQIDRITQRCPVPGKDPDTGEHLGDITTAHMPQVTNEKGKEVGAVGVYGHLVDTYGVLRVGDRVLNASEE